MTDTDTETKLADALRLLYDRIDYITGADSRDVAEKVKAALHEYDTARAQPASVAAGLPEPRLWITGTLTKRSEIVGFLRDEAVEREAEDRDVGIAPDHEGARLLAAVADALASDVLWSVAAAPRPPQPASAPDGQKPVVHCDRIDGIEHCLGDTQVAHLSGVHGHPRLGDIPYARTSRIVSIETKNTVYVIGNGAAPRPSTKESDR